MKESSRRILKSFIAVLISMMLYVLLLCVDKILSINHKEWLSFSNMYTPFFGSIAAIYVINKYAKDSIKSAKRRGIGTIVGGLFGMFLILLVEYIFLDLVGLNTSNINELIKWIEDLPKVDYLILSLDTIAYGGLIPSRRSCEKDVVIKNRIDKLFSLVKEKGAKVFAFSSPCDIFSTKLHSSSLSNGFGNDELLST